MTDTRSSSALFKRAEQLKRWEESDTNKQSALPKRASRIQFSSGIVFLAACTAGDKDEVQRLLKMGADINTANVDGLTALHQACIDDNLDMVEFLVAHGADVNRGDNEGWTALHATASCGFLSIARYLLENGADVGAVNYDGELAIDIAESDAMEELLQKAIDEKGVDCEKSRNAEVDTLLADARNWAANGYVEVRDPKTGGTPLHVAAAKGYLDVAKTLLEECNVEPDCVDYEGWTPLHAAALWGQKEACALLLLSGADPHRANYSGQTCMDLVDPSISSWLAEAALKASPRRLNNNNNNNKRRRSPPDAPHPPQPSHTPHAPHMKRVELQITGQDSVINEKGAELGKAGEKPPKGRAPSPGSPAPDAAPDQPADDAPSWRRSASFRRQEPTRENSKPANSTTTADHDTILRRTHSFENDKTFYQRYRDVTARIKASSCPSIPPPPPAAAPPATPAATATPTTTANTDRVVPERRDREANSWSGTKTPPATTVTTGATTSPTHTTTQTTVRSAESAVGGAGTGAGAGSGADSGSNSSNSTPSAATPTKLSPGNIFKNFFKSFVPPVRDEESETQRKAHAKRVRETRRSTQGVTLDEIKSAEQLVKKKTGNGTAEPPASPASPAPPAAAPASPLARKQDDAAHNATDNSTRVEGVAGAAAAEGAETRGATASATIAASAERRPSWRLRLDPTNKFDLEDASSGAPAGNSAEATVTVPLRRPPSGSTHTTSAPSAPSAAPAPPATAPPVSAPAPAPTLHDARPADDERESSAESKSSSASPASTQAALNVIQRRRRPKRRSTGVGRVDIDDIVTERGGADAGEPDTDAPSPQSGSERGRDEDEEGARDYKALYEASQAEVRRLRALLQTSEQQLRDVRATIACLTQNQNQNSMRLFERQNQSSLSELEKREKRAMERKLSEMEEELKQLQKLKAENERLRAENRALTRVVSKLTNSAHSAAK